MWQDFGGSLPSHIETSLSKPSERQVVFTTQYDSYLAWKYLCRIATKEVLLSTTDKERVMYSMGQDGVLYSSGRLPHPIGLDPNNPITTSFQFLRPVALASSKLVYSILIHLHWTHNHPGVERLVHIVLQVLHVENVRKVCKYIRKTCPRCRYILKKTIKVQVGIQSSLSCMVAPPFFSCQLDIACGD